MKFLRHIIDELDLTAMSHPITERFYAATEDRKFHFFFIHSHSRRVFRARFITEYELQLSDLRDFLITRVGYFIML